MYYYKFNISDWHLATSHLSLEEEAIYFKLINFYYDSEAPIPLETQSVCRRLRLGSYSGIVETVLHEFFIKSDDGWHHNRCDSELEKYHHKAEVNQKVGKLGGRPKNNPEKTQSVFKENPQETLTTNHKPLTTNHKPITPEGVSDSVFKDYMEVRKAKKAKWTETAQKGLIREASKAGISLEQAMVICIERNWQSLNASWLQQESLKTQDRPTQRWDATLEGIISKGKELGILPRPGETEGQYRERVRQA
jgi:uncharacterized protein YdaU (DUF1376 family)